MEFDIWDSGIMSFLEIMGFPLKDKKKSLVKWFNGIWDSSAT